MMGSDTENDHIGSRKGHPSLKQGFEGDQDGEDWGATTDEESDKIKRSGLRRGDLIAQQRDEEQRRKGVEKKGERQSLLPPEDPDEDGCCCILS